MPVIKSAIKKQRKDKVRTVRNNSFRSELDRALKLAKKTKTPKSISAAESIVDRAVKNNIIHKNRAARIKSSLSKLAKPQTKTSGTTAKAETKKTTKPTPKKTAK